MGLSLNREQRREILKRPCPCGSGKKYKNCCFMKDLDELEERKKRGLETEKKA